MYQHQMGIDWEENGGKLGEDFEEVVAHRRDNGVEWLVLDIERYAQSQAGYLAWALRHYRSALPGKRMGFYGFFPPTAYWDVILERAPAGFSDNEDKEKYFALAEEVDAFFPSLYTHYNRPSEWEAYSRKVVSRSRELTRIVMPFVWPQYHPGSDKAIGLSFMESKVWRNQLDLMHEIADGVVIWGGWRDRDGERLNWDAEAPWWKETLAFMREMGIGAPDNPQCPQ